MISSDGISESTLGRSQASPWWRACSTARTFIEMIIVIIVLTACTHADSGEDAASHQLIMDRYLEYLLERSPLEADVLGGHVRNLDAQGAWPDISYNDRTGADWKAIEHLRRVKALALALNTRGHALHNDKAVAQAALKALTTWLHRRTSGAIASRGWWWTKVGEPRFIRDIFVLLERRIDKTSRHLMVEALKPAKIGKTGANLMWLADLTLHRGAFTKDSDLVRKAALRISGSIRKGGKEGIQADWSFHQHGARLQAFHYGGAYLRDASRIAWQLKGTPWEFDKGKHEILAQYALEGLQWMCRGVYTVPSTMDRMCSRKRTLRSANLVSTIRQLRHVLPGRSTSFDAFIARQKDGGKQLIGHRHFPLSDFTTYHRPGFSFFIKTVSNRTHMTERINGENRRGGFLNWGDHYLLRQGDEYYDLPPVWNWYMLPGLTTAAGIGGSSHIVRRPFTGAVSNNRSGLTTMETLLEDKSKTKRLSCRKAWACHGDTIVAMISDLDLTGSTGGTTSLEQCRLKGDVSIAFRGKDPIKFEGGRKTLDDVHWIHHNRTAYVPLGQHRIRLQAGPQSGSWNAINKQYSKNTVTEEVFGIQIPHERTLDGQAFGYAIISGVDIKETQTTVANPSFRILRNDASCQALRFNDGVWLAAFYEPGELEIEKEVMAKVSIPCLVLHDGKTIWASDPTNKGRALSIGLTGQAPAKINLPPSGSSVIAVQP